MTFSESLRAIVVNGCEEEGLSLYQLAKEAGVAPSQIYRFLSGERGLSMDVGDKVFAALKIDIQSARPLD